MEFLCLSPSVGPAHAHLIVAEEACKVNANVISQEAAETRALQTRQHGPMDPVLYSVLPSPPYGGRAGWQVPPAGLRHHPLHAQGLERH